MVGIGVAIMAMVGLAVWWWRSAGGMRIPASHRHKSARGSLAPVALLLFAVLVGGLGCDGGDMEEGTRDVVVVGGGIAGLTAAHMLKDHDVILLEKEPGVGGRALSGTHEGVTYAKGTEYLGEVEGALAEVAKEIGMEPVEIPSPMDAKTQDGKVFIGEEAVAGMLIERAGLGEYNRFVSTVQKAASKIDDGDDAEIQRLDRMSTLAWFQENGFAPAFSEFYNVSCRGLFGANLAESSALCMVPEIAFDYTHEKSVHGPHRHKKELGSEGSGAYTFKGGIAALCQGIAKTLGERVRLGCKVVDVKREGEGYTVSYVDGGGQARMVRTRTVILAVPSPIALKVASGALTGEQKELMTSVPYAQYMTVALFSRTPIFNEAFDLAVPDGMFFTDLYPGGWAEGTDAKNAQAHVLSAYVATKSYKDNLLAMTDEEAFRRVQEDVDRLFPGASRKVTGHEIQRFPYAYPVMTVGAFERMERLRKTFANGLYLAGDYLTHPTFDSAADSGATAAEQCTRLLASIGK